jgi:DNA-binding Lrp family transcriptional regulator
MTRDDSSPVRLPPARLPPTVLQRSTENLWPTDDMADDVDRLDGALLREMFRGRHLWVGGVDPRLSAGALARALRVDRTTIWARLKAWKDSGFLTGFDVVPNPDLFGRRFGAGSVRVDNPVQKDAVVRDLGLIDGIVGSQDMLGPWIVVLAACASTEDFERCSALLRRLNGVNETIPLVAFQCPSSTATPTPLDWKMIQELRKPPTPLPNELAKRLKISLKTVARHYDALIRNQLIWYIPLLDYTRYSNVAIVRFNVYLSATGDPSKIVRMLRSRFPEYVDIADRSEFAVDPARKVKHIVTVLQLPTAALSEDVQTEILSMPGVAEVEVLFPRKTFSYPRWMAERILSRISDAEASRRRRTAS